MQQEQQLDLFFSYQDNFLGITTPVNEKTTIRDLIQMMTLKLLEINIVIDEKWVDCSFEGVLLKKEQLILELFLQDQVIELLDYFTIKKRINQKYIIRPEEIKEKALLFKKNKCIAKCLSQLAESNSQAQQYFKAFPEADSLTLLRCFIIGPKKSPYENGIYQLIFDFGNQYPYKPPQIQFITKIKHPNINNGKINLDILQENWSPALARVEPVLISVINLLNDPNLRQALDDSCFLQYQKDQDAYNQVVEGYKKQYASPQIESLIFDLLGDQDFNENDYEYLVQQFTDWIQYWKNF